MKKSISLLLLLSSFLINGQIINFADANFKNSLVNSTSLDSPAKGFDDNYLKVDANSDGEIQISEALLVKSLSYSYGCGPGACAGVKIGDFQGLTSFSNLEVFSAWGQDAAVLDLKNLSHLKTLKYSNNGSAYIDYNFTGATNLEDITVYRVGQSVDFTGLINLKKAIIISNNLTTLDLRSNTNLESFQCEGTVINKSNLININFDGLSKLKEIYLFYCKLSNINSLSLNGLSSLKKLYCRENNITNLNLSSCTNLEFLDCRNNLFLESIFLKNGKNEYYISLEGNPNLRYICQDQDNVLGLQQYVDSLNYTNCLVSSFCSFNPGGVYYTVQGGQKFDFNNNGCDSADSSLPNVKYTISPVGSSNPADYIISKEDGSYHVDLPAGNFSVSPSFENPSYYTSNPTILNVSFPTQSSPFTQDFCITANGAHPDLEIVIIPIQQARPGFDAAYKIIVKNKGTIAQSGTLNLAFDDAVLDFVSSNPTVSNQSLNSFSWDFLNLNPFETKTINLVLNLNSPLEIPALNMGDLLHFSASVTSAETDETPLDNTFSLNQTVVNSFDPNDITCLEGETVPLTDNDFYLHYIVRFENTGNYSAQNIVVEDIIDTNVYNAESLAPLSSSHPFYTIKKYSNEYGAGTIVQFIFENINLPFTSGSNTGYVAFKIKTRHPYYDFSQSIWNKKAKIYFDYNYPIKTNMVSTSMKTLSSEDFNGAKKNAFYPNPANGKIYFNQEQKSVTIFTVEGKKINRTLKNKEMDISELPKGVYLLQINTLENTLITQKLIKN